jgi:hypothetical protein
MSRESKDGGVRFPLGAERKAMRLVYELYVEQTGEGRRASLGDAALWLLSAMATGIIGNVAHEQLKALVTKVRGPSAWRTVVPESYYEGLRAREHRGAPSVAQTEMLEVELRALPPKGIPEAFAAKCVVPVIEGADSECPPDLRAGIKFEMICVVFEECELARRAASSGESFSRATRMRQTKRGKTKRPHAKRSRGAVK